MFNFNEIVYKNKGWHSRQYCNVRIILYIIGTAQVDLFSDSVMSNSVSYFKQKQFTPQLVFKIFYSLTRILKQSYPTRFCNARADECPITVHFFRPISTLFQCFNSMQNSKVSRKFPMHCIYIQSNLNFLRRATLSTVYMFCHKYSFRNIPQF